MEADIANRHASPILVTGGTGTLGRFVVRRLLQAGRDVRVLSRRRHDNAGAVNPRDERIEFVTGDVATGEGVDAAVHGVETIVHLAGTAKGDEDKARHLMRAASRSAVRHVVYISVVGADRLPLAGRMDRAVFGYFGAKLAAERLVADSGLPWTTLRSTQFHQAMLKTAEGMAKLPVIPVPSGFRFQPVDAEEVADRLRELALGEPAGLVPDIGGPRVYEMAELIRGYLRATRKHRAIIPAWVPGKAARAYRAGANLALDRAVGRRTWEEFLAERTNRQADSAAKRAPA
ncbi:MAG: SDR family NAD(P)-dependent oxidoreductase [Chloroflexota bacterium]|nr:SDR family NAD(P)-dependent oxidoreductase [Chloroflexota bacterium]